MAKSNFKKITSIKDTEGGNFGNYEEEKGGGTPRGGVWGGKDGRVGWGEREKSGELPQGAHREDQPRTKDGKFTYNSTNGKETKYESRGKTVNPLLTGGENGIMIEDAKKQFAAKQGNLWDKYGATGKWYQKGSELITKNGRKYAVKLSDNDIWEIARVSFNLKEGAFNYEKENFGKTKTGRRSKFEKTAIQQAKQNKGETFVKTPTGAIQQKPGSGQGQQLSTGIQFQLNPSIISKFRKMQAIRAAGMPGAGTATFSQPTAPANGPATQLKPGQKPSFAINPNIISNLGGIVKQFMTQPVAQQKPQGVAVPKVSMGGFLNNHKK